MCFAGVELFYSECYFVMSGSDGHFIMDFTQIIYGCVIDNIRLKEQVSKLFSASF